MSTNHARARGLWTTFFSALLAVGAACGDDGGGGGSAEGAAGKCRDAVELMCQLASACSGNVGTDGLCSATCAPYRLNCESNEASEGYWDTCIDALEADQMDATLSCSNAAFLNEHYELPAECGIPNTGGCPREPGS